MQTESPLIPPLFDNTEFSYFAEQLPAELGAWDSWLDKLESQPAKPLRKLINKTCLFWGMPTRDVIQQPVIARLLLLKWKLRPHERDAGFSEAAERWCEQAWAERERPSVAHLVEGIAWAYGLPYLAHRMERDEWETLLHALGCSVGNESCTSAIAKFVTSVELPLTLAHSLPQLSCCKSLRKPARQRFSVLLEQLLDGEGMPHAEHLADMQYLLASCTRTLLLDAEAKKGRIKQASLEPFDWLTRAVLRWARPGGGVMLSTAADSPYFAEMLEHALQLTGDETDRLAMRRLIGKRVAKDEIDDAPPPAEHSEWSEVACLRTSWQPSAVRLGVAYHNRTYALELGAGKTMVLAGPAQPTIEINGECLQQDSDWAEVCWESDEDVDYLELECTLTGQWRLQRQLLLARNDQFVFFADAVLGPSRSDIRYRLTLPVCEDVSLESSAENTEAQILGQRKLGYVIPLALPEWKAALDNDRLRDEPLRLEMATNGPAIYAPWFISLQPSLRNKPLTWRQLTVAEDLLIVPRERAVAYRVQVGNRQWVVYRSLTPPANRTFLGQNVISDFFVARFGTDCKTETLIDVEPA